MLLIHHPETFAYNLQDLSARCSSVKRNWDTLIRPHLLSKSALRRSNLLIINVTFGMTVFAASHGCRL